MLKGNKLKQEYRTLSFVYFDTHQLYKMKLTKTLYIPLLKFLLTSFCIADECRNTRNLKFCTLV